MINRVNRLGIFLLCIIMPQKVRLNFGLFFSQTHLVTRRSYWFYCLRNWVISLFWQKCKVIVAVNKDFPEYQNVGALHYVRKRHAHEIRGRCKDFKRVSTNKMEIELGDQGCQMVCFQTKIQIWVNFEGLLMVNGGICILSPFGIFYGHLV
jgi:hypothetical protein